MALAKSRIFTNDKVIAKSLLVYWTSYPHFGNPGKFLSKSYFQAIGIDKILSEMDIELQDPSFFQRIQEFVKDMA